LYVSEQQYVYARGNVVVAINNDDDRAEIQWDTDLTDGTVMHDRLGGTADVVVAGRKIKVRMKGRTAAIFVRKDQ
jgi:hypothetical protein